MPDWVWVLVIVGSALLTYLASMAVGGRARSNANPAKREPEQEPIAIPPPPPRRVPTPAPPTGIEAHAPRRLSSGAVPVASGRATAAIPGDDTVPLGRAPVSVSTEVAFDDLPRFDHEDDDDVDPTKVTRAPTTRGVQPPTKRIVYDEDAAPEEPTNAGDLILVTAKAQTDKGKRRKRNEDSLLMYPDENLFVVADGMGGYNGGEIASRIAVETIESAFKAQTFAGEAHTTIPWRASELARSIQMANEAILDRANGEPQLQGMGTTICAARFSPRKQRLYVGHVGDSRLYRLRGTAYEQITSDHTMSTLGVTGEGAAHLSRAVGVWPTVPIDVIIVKPLPGDLYLLCSDGLTKMLADTEVRKILLANVRLPIQDLADTLVARANEAGGKDNISIILVSVQDAIGQHVALVKSQQQAG